jgi:hypothetical protein
MKHIELFEGWDAAPSETESTYRAPRRNAVPDLNPLRDTQEYQDLLAAGFTDVSAGNPLGLRQGNIRFAHPALGEKTIRVNQNGSMWIDWSNGKSMRTNNNSAPLTSIEDYARKLTELPRFISGSMFEGWEQTEMDFKMTPEQFQKAIEDAMATKSTADAIRSVKKILDENPHLRKNVEGMRAAMLAISPLVNSISPEERAALRDELDPAGAASRKQLALGKQAKIQAAADLLDSFESGQIDREEFLKEIAGVR